MLDIDSNIMREVRRTKLRHVCLICISDEQSTLIEIRE